MALNGRQGTYHSAGYKKSTGTSVELAIFISPDKLNPVNHSVTEEDRWEFIKHAATGTVVTVNRLKLSDDVDLRCITFSPAIPSPYPPLLFIPGLGAVIESFSGVVKALSAGFVVHYLETREKRTSVLKEGLSFSVRDIAADIAAVVEKTGLQEGNYIMACYSLSGTAAAESFNGLLKTKPSLLVLAEPAGEFRLPAAELFFARHFWKLYGIVKPLIKLYLKIFRINSKGDYEMYRIACRVLDSADPRKLSSVICDISGYSVYHILQKIDVPVAVIGVSHDKFHGNNEPEKIAAAISGSLYFDLENNIRSHSSEVADIITNRFSSI